MGCTQFGERWDMGVDDLLTDAAKDTIASAGVTLDDIDAFWLGTMGSGVSGITLSKPLKIDYKPVSRNENFCATGSEAFRNACYAVASGAYDLAMAIGVEKLKDSGFSGLTGIRPVGDGTDPQLSSPAAFSFLAPAYAHKYGVTQDGDEGRDEPHRVEEPSQRRGEPAGAVPQGGVARDDRAGAAGRRRARRVRLQRRERRRRPRPSSAGSRTPTATPTTRCT